MSKGFVVATALSAILVGATTARAQDGAFPPVRFGYTSPWHYDGRNDRRDFPANGYFPGNFAAEWWAPPSAGLFGSRPERSPYPYASQVYFGSPCSRCAPRD